MKLIRNTMSVLARHTAERFSTVPDFRPNAAAVAHDFAISG
jgi:hypothetical protein